MVELATSSDFDTFILIVIGINAVVFSLMDYVNPLDKSQIGNMLNN